MFGGAFIIATAGKSKELEINGQIRDREVRLIGADGEQKGVVSIQVAMRAAEDAGLDLVKIAPQAVPPVCKVLDYGKYRFEQQKKEKEAKKNQKVVEVKDPMVTVALRAGQRGLSRHHAGTMPVVDMDRLEQLPTALRRAL